MKSAVIKRSVVIAGHKTSVSIEDEFWDAMKEIAKHRNMTLSKLAARSIVIGSSLICLRQFVFSCWPSIAIKVANSNCNWFA
jgi:hypothetical protein